VSALALAALSLAAPQQPPAGDLDVVVQAVAARCIECHREEKTKGGLRLDVADGWREVMDDGAPADSELYYRVDLPASDFDAMPPSGDRMTADERGALLRFLTEPDMDGLDARLTALRDAAAASEALRASVAARTGARITIARAPGGERGAGARFAVDWSLADATPGADAVAALEPLAAFVSELSFAGQAIDVNALPPLPALRRVHAERSGLRAPGLRALLERAPALEYLNVHSCPLDDAAVPALTGRDGLRRLVLFGTEVTEGGVARLGTDLARCEITPPTAARSDPFAAAEAREPRRVVVATEGEGGGALTLFRERAIGHPEAVWTARPGVGAETVFESVAWLGDAGAPGSGHGRFALGIRLGAGTTPATYDSSLDALERGEDASPDAPVAFADGARVTVSEDGLSARITRGEATSPLWPGESSEGAPRIRRVQPLGETVVLWLDRGGDGRLPAAIEIDAAGEELWSFTAPEGTPPITAGVVVPRHGSSRAQK